ncbi:MAG: cell division protein ZapE [Chlorobiales bacterium]|nr:cell division protein ZapE [Chlorobiales bacterium]
MMLLDADLEVLYRVKSDIFDINDIRADVDTSHLKSRLVPPPRFQNATLENYIPDDRYPSQRQAKEFLVKYAADISAGHERNPLYKLFRSASKSSTQGVYIDGYFGVGKTHLLAGFYHAVQTPLKAYFSFTELMYLIGLCGMDRFSAEMSHHKLICIDEFELDDPGNTTMALGFLSRMFEAGVRIVTTSNTPPLRLGEGRFAASNFRREIGELAAHFKVLKIDGQDYRKKKASEPNGSLSCWRIENPYEAFQEYTVAGKRQKLFLTQSDLCHLLKQFHPMQYHEVAEHLESLFMHGMTPILDQYDALRFVYFIDKLYDEKVKIFASSDVPVDELFPQEFYRSAYAKKYMRCVSRLKEVCHAA